MHISQLKERMIYLARYEINVKEIYRSTPSPIKQNGTKVLNQVWYLLLGSTYLMSKSIKQNLRFFSKAIRKYPKPSTDKETAPLVGITDTDVLSIEEVNTNKKNETEQAPSLFQRSVAEGARIEGDAFEDVWLTEEYSISNESNQKPSATLLFSQSYITTRRFLTGLLYNLRNGTQTFIQRASQKGIAIQKINRQKRALRKKNIGRYVEKYKKQLWNNIGIADKQELETLRLEVNQLKNSIKLRGITPPVASPIQPERRKQHLAVAYERRLVERRA